jgi:MFS family permease
MEAVRRKLGKPFRLYKEFTEKWPRAYSIYVLMCLTTVYLINQMDRFLVAISSKKVFSDLGFGTKGCLPTGALRPVNETCAVKHCQGFKDNANCSLDSECVWAYLGSGTEYQVLAGPAFTVIFTLFAIPLGFSASFKWINRKLVLSLSIVLWSIMTLLSSFSANFAELLVTRIGLGLFESVCTPYATSILTDYFVENRRGVALGVYNWGIYIGFSLTFVFEFILNATDWRWVFRIGAIPGMFVAVLLAVTVLEPKRQQHSGLSRTSCSVVSVKMTVKAFLNPALICVCIAGGVRQGAGLVFAYNIKPFTIDEYCDEEVIGRFMSWVPLIGGSFGALLGGYVSDKLRKKAGGKGRICVLILSQVSTCVHNTQHVCLMFV